MIGKNVKHVLYSQHLKTIEMKQWWPSTAEGQMEKMGQK